MDRRNTVILESDGKLKHRNKGYHIPRKEKKKKTHFSCVTFFCPSGDQTGTAVKKENISCCNIQKMSNLLQALPPQCRSRTLLPRPAGGSRREGPR